jgi:hypothetical protein
MHVDILGNKLDECEILSCLAHRRITGAAAEAAAQKMAKGPAPALRRN